MVDCLVGFSILRAIRVGCDIIGAYRGSLAGILFLGYSAGRRSAFYQKARRASSVWMDFRFYRMSFGHYPFYQCQSADRPVDYSGYDRAYACFAIGVRSFSPGAKSAENSLKKAGGILSRKPPA
jgi:hypothetical protein